MNKQSLSTTVQMGGVFLVQIISYHKAGYSNMRKNQTHTEKVSNRPLAELRDLLDE